MSEVGKRLVVIQGFTLMHSSDRGEFRPTATPGVVLEYDHCEPGRGGI